MMQQNDRLVSFSELQGLVGGLSRTTVWRLVRANRFPAPVQITARRKGWYLSAVLEWVRARGATGCSAVAPLAVKGQ